jgi:hypothetical protein
MLANIPWWGWLLIAAVCWYLQLVMSIRTDDGGKAAWTIRILFITGMAFSVLVGMIRFVKWAWHG